MKKAFVAIENDQYRNIIAEFLRKNGIAAVEIKDEDEFLRNLRKHDRIDLCVVEWDLPPNGAYATLGVLKKKHPDAYILVTNFEPLEGPEFQMYIQVRAEEFHLMAGILARLRTLIAEKA